MDLLLTILLDDLLPIFVVASVGFLLARRLHVEVTSLSRVTFNALAPCLVFSLLVTSQVSNAVPPRAAEAQAPLLIVPSRSCSSPPSAWWRGRPRSRSGSTGRSWRRS